MPARAIRVRIGGLTLALHDPRPRTSAAPRSHRPFLVPRGSDIRIRVVPGEPPPARPGRLLFDSGGAWRALEDAGGLRYEFRAPAFGDQPYKSLRIDCGLREGVLYLPHGGAEKLPHWALDYPLDELLFQHRLALDGALEVHACGLVVFGRVALFCGQSGAGKSTTARLWRRLSPRTRILSDDRIVLRPRARAIEAHGTPWHGDGGFARAAHAPLGAVFVLARATSTRLRRLAPAEAAGRLLARGFPPPWDTRAWSRALALSARIAESVPCYELAFVPDASAVAAVRDAFAGADAPLSARARPGRTARARGRRPAAPIPRPRPRSPRA